MTITRDKTGINISSYNHEKDINDLLFNYKDSICLILRHPSMGHLCGYVGLSEGHKLYKSHYDTISNEIDCDVELTWSGFRVNSQMARFYPDLWWVGFDCGHWEDWIPKMPRQSLLLTREQVYRNIPWVMEKCMQLSDSLVIKNNISDNNSSSRDIEDEIGLISKEMQEHALSLLAKGRLSESIDNDYVCEQAVKIVNLAKRLEMQRKDNNER